MARAASLFSDELCPYSLSVESYVGDKSGMLLNMFLGGTVVGRQATVIR